MANQTRSAQQPDKKNGHKPEPAPLTEPAKESAGIADLTAETPLGASHADGGMNLAIEVARLSDPRLHTVQRVPA